MTLDYKMNEEAEFQLAEEPEVKAATSTHLAAISVQSRLLPFWRELPRAWFVQFEAVVEPLKTKDDQKYRYVLQQLQAADLQHLTDILYNPPATDKYGAIKKRLLAVYDKSDVENFKKLISGLELGEQKPTQLLRKMRELGSGMITDEGLKIEWLNQLPTQIRVVLSMNSESSLDTLAAMADKMVEYSEPKTIATLSTSNSASTSNTVVSAQLELLSKQIEKLSFEVAEIRGRSSYRPRFTRSRSRSRSNRNPKSTKPGDPEWECRYHYKFGDRAMRCELPCKRAQKTSPKSSEN